MIFNFEIDLSDYGLTKDDQPWWLGYDCLIAEGNTLDELLENAEVYLTDQDGGEGPNYSIGDSSHFETLENILIAKYESVLKFYKYEYCLKSRPDKPITATLSQYKTDIEAAAQALHIINRLHGSQNILPKSIKVFPISADDYMERHMNRFGSN